MGGLCDGGFWEVRHSFWNTLSLDLMNCKPRPGKYREQDWFHCDSYTARFQNTLSSREVNYNILATAIGFEIPLLFP